METYGSNWRRWVRRFRVMTVLVFVLLVIVAFSWWGPKEEIRQVSGTVAGYKRTDSETGGTPTLIVKLDPSNRVLVEIGDDVPVHLGAEVVLIETKTRFGFRHHDFMGYTGATDSRRNKAER